MARYIKTPDVWELDEAARAALQPGQWITCGGNFGRVAFLSRFYRHTAHHDTAFHGPNATRKMREYVAANRAAANRKLTSRA